MTTGPARVEEALARVELLEPGARAAAHEAIAALLAVHEEGLRRLAAELGRRDAGLLEELAGDEAVAGLFLLHGVHPLPLEERVARAIAGVPAAGGRAELVSVGPDAIRLRASGSEGWRRALARAVSDAAPEVGRVEIEPAGGDGFVPLARLAPRAAGRGEAAGPAAEHERCGLCGQPLAGAHDHLFDVGRRRLTCACAGCALLLDHGGAFRRVRRAARPLEAIHISDAQWAALGVPVGLAFFSLSSALEQVVAAYPGPAGAIESLVDPAAWDALVAANPVLAELEPDVSALLAVRLGAAPRYHLLSIDECYRLTGLVRSRWQGLTGGDGPTRAVDEFFAGLAGSAP